jgi:hypothetical protein
VCLIMEAKTYICMSGIILTRLLYPQVYAFDCSMFDQGITEFDKLTKDGPESLSIFEETVCDCKLAKSIVVKVRSLIRLIGHVQDHALSICACISYKSLGFEHCVIFVKLGFGGRC